MHGVYIKVIICLIRKLRETKKEFTSAHYLGHKTILLAFLKNNKTHLFRVQTFPEVECPAQVTFFLLVGTEYTYSKLYMYIRGSPVDIQTPANWNLIGRG
jgi:hypothetical protein